MDLTPVFIFAIISVALYKILQLFVCRRERLAIIEKISDGISATRICEMLKNQFGDYTTLRWGSLAIGFGIGMLITAIVALTSNWDTSIPHFYQYRQMLAGGIIILCGGLGLIAGYIIESKQRKDAEK
ncbi:MAG: hypothetical protein HDS65_01315 [Bacteroidales bacterium]|nr:hypothetical protein [Bacteroidales bacterium]